MGIYKMMGGEIVSVYDKLVQMARDATIGMTDDEVLDMTGLKFATWRKWLGGKGVTERTVLQFCAFMGLDASPFIEELQKATCRYMSHDRIMMAAIELGDMPQESKRELMSQYRRIIDDCKKKATA
jgi:hypothetical protein